jgi:hypothetical protein
MFSNRCCHLASHVFNSRLSLSLHIPNPKLCPAMNVNASAEAASAEATSAGAAATGTAAAGAQKWDKTQQRDLNLGIMEGARRPNNAACEH